MSFDPAYTASWYDEYGSREWDRWDRTALMKLQYEVYAHHLSKLVDKGDRVLDAGCGAGRFTKELITLGAEVVALDISSVQLDLCRERAPGAKEYLQGSITDLVTLEDESFDTVLALGGVLSYCFEQVETALSELNRVARAGAQVMLSVMNLFGTIHEYLPGVMRGDALANARWLQDGVLLRELNDGHECKLYRESELRELLRTAGFEDVRIEAPGWLAGVHKLELPESGSPQWRYLLAAELAASREVPAAGTHLVAFARKPAG